MSWNDLRKGRYSEQSGEYFITFVTVNRSPCFCDFKLANTFCKNIKVNELERDCKWLTWVLMPDHFHGLLQLRQNNLSKVVAHLKASTAKQLNEVCSSQGRFWQPAFYDHALRAEEDRKKIARYIVANPVRARIVSNVRNYPYWDSVYL